MICAHKFVRNGAQLALIKTCNLPFSFWAPIHKHHTQTQTIGQTHGREWDSGLLCNRCALMKRGGGNKYVYINRWAYVYNKQKYFRQTLSFTSCALPLFSLWTQNWCTFWNFYRLNVQMNTYLLGSLILALSFSISLSISLLFTNTLTLSAT